MTHPSAKSPGVFVLVGLRVLGFVCFLCFCFLVVFSVLFCSVLRFCDDVNREQDYVSVLHQLTFQTQGEQQSAHANT